MKKVAEIKTIKSLENHPGANCTVVEFDNGNVDFISYSTLNYYDIKKIVGQGFVKM